MAHNQQVEINECPFCNGKSTLEIDKNWSFQDWLYKIGLFRTELHNTTTLQWFREFRITGHTDCPLCDGKGQIERTVDYDDGRED